MAKNHLINNFETTSMKSFEDFFLVIAKNIEDSLIMAGATPEKDYTILDLYKLAQPFVLHKFKEDNELIIFNSWRPTSTDD